MKHLARFVVSGGALWGLLFATVSQATDIERRPLRADAQVRPNVVFGMDDSGSMDWEVLLATNQGQFQWDTTNKKGWDNNGVFVSSNEYSMGYLFPTGTGTGGQNFPESNADNGRSVPPSSQLAALRSSAFNPLYYNPAITYNPWPPAYHGGADKTYTAATITAAKSHPAIAGTITMDLVTSQKYKFYYAQGMLKPDGTIHSGSATQVETTWVPATYWVLDPSCTLGSATDFNSNCARAPGYATDTTKKLRRVVLTSSSPEAQNFANWWSYARKRKLMLAGSMGVVMEDLATTPLRMGVVAFNDRVSPTMYNADAAANASNRRRIAGIFYTNPADSGTPTHETLNYIGSEYNTNTNLVQYSCQRNNAFIVTDGFATGSQPTPPSYTASKFGSNAEPYAVTEPKSLADIALSYYINELRSGGGFVKGRVPEGQGEHPDTNTDLHMNTYAMTLGARGTVWPGVTDPWKTHVDWPTAELATPKSIDDLFHATINGRGQMYIADSPTQTAKNIRAGLEDILGKGGAQSAVAVASVNLRRGDNRAYMGSYNSKGWAGDIMATSLDHDTAIIGSPGLWSASVQLSTNPWASRVIATSVGGTGVAFDDAASVAVVNPGAVYGSNTDVMSYLRGNPAKEDNGFRVRPTYDVPLQAGLVKNVHMLMSAVINAQPVADNGVVFAASGEGMLHAFKADTGDELWAFVPPQVLSKIGATTDKFWSFKTLLDGSPKLQLLSSGETMLVGGLGSAGAGYYALDVKSAADIKTASDLASRVKWEFPGSTGALVGVSIGKPQFIKHPVHGDVVLLTQGYNASTDGKTRLYMVNAKTGALLHGKDDFVANSGVGGVDPGLAQVAALAEPDGTTRYVYGGDELGNVWRFDLVTGVPGDRVKRLAQLKDGSGGRQPITAAPELVRWETSVIVMVGTGRMLGFTDFNPPPVMHSFYAIKDGAELLNARSALTQRTFGGDSKVVETDTINWNTGRGWYFDMPSGQMVTSDPAIAMGAVVFTSNKASASDCTAASYLYVVTVLDGKTAEGMSYAVKQLSNTLASPVQVVSTSKNDLVGFGQTDDGKSFREDLNMIPPINKRKLSWRQIKN